MLSSRTLSRPNNSPTGSDRSNSSRTISSPAAPTSTRANIPATARNAVFIRSAASTKTILNLNWKMRKRRRCQPMSKSAIKAAPPDQSQRDRALRIDCSVLVQAPAGSGKTDLLTRRFLSLLAEVDEPGQIVAITFTKAAAAEMRHRILAELEKASKSSLTAPLDDFSMEALARRALARSRALGWQVVDLPPQLRISTIDSFCRELAIQQPLLSGFGSDLRVAEQPYELYHRAARRTLQSID